MNAANDNLHMKVQKVIPRQAGFTLLEVLIAVVVLSFGVLGMVGLQAASLQANRDARLQAVAARLGQELVDMMGANRSIAQQTTAAGNPYLFDSSSGVYPAPPEDCFLVACTSTLDVAHYEMSEWMGRVVGGAGVPAELPGARVVVCFDSDPFAGNGTANWACNNTGSVAVVKIGWTRMSTKRAATAAAAFELATAPSIVLPVSPLAP